MPKNHVAKPVAEPMAITAAFQLRLEIRTPFGFQPVETWIPGQIAEARARLAEARRHKRDPSAARLLALHQVE